MAKRHRSSKKILPLLLVILLVLPTCLVASGFGYLGYQHDTDPEGYEQLIARILQVRSDFQLSVKDEETVISLGLDPTSVANSIAAIEWVEKEWGVQLDLAILHSVYSGESGGGNNLGSSPGIAAAMSNPNLNPAREQAAAITLLSRWQEYDIRSSNPIAAEYILSDYSDYFGHASAGELGGGGFIPTTALRVCINGLSRSDDPTVQSCDYWDQKTMFFAMAYEIQRMGYRSELSDEEKVAVLYGWNHSESYRRTLIETANHYESIGLTTVTDFDAVTTAFGFGGGNQEEYLFLRKTTVDLFDLVGLIPSDWDEQVINNVAGLPEGVLDPNLLQLTIDLARDVPVADGRSANVALWSKLNPTISIPAGGTWSFCTQTNLGGWGQYTTAAGFLAGGICANASVVKNWAVQVPGLELVSNPGHTFYPAYPIFTVGILCPNSDLVIRNTTDQEIVGQWSIDGQILILQTVGSSTEETTTTQE
mgnify:CR=1 FL=1